MRISNFGRYALAFCAGVEVLAGCGGSQSQIETDGALPRSPAIVTHAKHGHSWMAGDATKKDLLYISDDSTRDVYVYTYPAVQRVGTLTGFADPQGLCVDKAGNVYITLLDGRVLEYAHGGTTPIKTLSAGSRPLVGCSVDRVTGNLAVTARYNLAIFKNARSKPAHYGYRVTGHDAYLTSCAYDNAGNLFVAVYLTPTCPGCFFGLQLAELAKGSQRLKEIWFAPDSQSGYIPGGVQWDGQYVAFGETQGVIYRITRKGHSIGSSIFDRANTLAQFWLQGHTLIGPNNGSTTVMFWNYPGGREPIRTLKDLRAPFGVTVSLDQN